MPIHLQAIHGTLIATGLWLATASSATAAQIDMVYLGLASHQHVAATEIDPPPTDTGLRGAQLAVADTNTTGQFTNQSFALQVITAPDADTLAKDFAQALAAGRKLFVANLPADLLLKLADTPAAKNAVILDATSEDDRLRQQDCRANMLHIQPSRAMLADALMEYLVTKNWRHIMLLVGRDPADALYADAVRNAAGKFQIAINADRPWTFNPASQQADTGHYQVNDEVVKATQGASYDVLVVADEADHFGDDLAYRTDSPRPIAGTQGLTPASWSRAMDEYASTQLQTRFFHTVGRWMSPQDYGGWLAVRAIGEAATRAQTVDPAGVIGYLRGPDFTLSGYKGPELTFRPWDGQLRQPVLLADDHSLISISPQPGFLHQTNDLDSLGVDQPETACHMK
jgi:ABC transporter substrate binding protein (PQQ-dependent alcohol dehydrogenase system)